MTLPGDNHSDNSKPDRDGHKALAPAGTSPVNPFVAQAAEPGLDGTPRPFYARLLDYSAHAAIIIGLIGFAWTVSDHVVGRPASAAHQASAAPTLDTQMAQLQATNIKLRDDLKTLRATVDTLRATVRRDTTPEQVRMLSAGLEAMKTSLSTTNASMAQISGKVDKLQPAKLHELSERVARLERQALDPAPTASFSRSATEKPQVVESAPKPPVKPTVIAKADETPAVEDPAKPQIISGWVVRDVYRGVALVEGKRGVMEVMPGMTIPGAGTVKSIDRHGGGWTVTTTKGQLAYEAMSNPGMSNPGARDYRRDAYEGGGYYPRYRYGY
jgi:hypothetical protein